MSWKDVVLWPAISLALVGGCSKVEELTAPDELWAIQLVNPRDSNYLADSLAPPPPKVWVEPLVQGLRVRFNGQFSETTPDEISGIADFEGYSIYLAGHRNARGWFILIASCDLEDYDKWVWNTDTSRYVLLDCPYSLDSLKCLYGGPPEPCLDTDFYPFAYTASRPYVHPSFPESLLYFQSHGFNVAEYGVNTPIRKVYPDATDPSTVQFPSMHPELFTADGYYKFYEYEYEISDLYPFERYWVNVTAFDFGYPVLGIQPSETDYWSGAIGAIPLSR